MRSEMLPTNCGVNCEKALEHRVSMEPYVGNRPNVYVNIPGQGGKETSMLNTVKQWLGQIIEVGLLLVAIGILLQILFGRMVGFITGDIVGNLIAIIQQLGDGGLVGLIAIGIILWLFQRRSAM